MLKLGMVLLMVLMSGCVSPKSKQDNNGPTTKPTQQTGTSNIDQKPEQVINAPTKRPTQQVGLLTYQGGDKNIQGIDPAILKLALYLVAGAGTCILFIIILNTPVIVYIAKHYAVKFGYAKGRMERLEIEKKEKKQ